LATASDLVSSEFEPQFDLLQIDEDWYEVEVQAGEGLFVAEIFPFARVDEIVLGLHDAGGTLVESVATAEGETRLENASLAAGTYFLRITGKNLGGGYALAWSSGNEDNYEENDALVDAYDLTANPSTPLSLIDGPGAQYDEDWFSVTLAEDDSAITAKLDFQHDLGDLDLFLINEDAEILESSIGTSDNETISLSGLAAGTYYLQVVGTNLGNEYDLSWSAFADDNYEENDDFSESFALGGATSGTLSPIDGPGVRGSDDDYYALSIPFGHVSLEVTATFAHAEGDIALELFDGQQSSLVSSDSGTDDESVFTAVDPNGGTIFVLVSGANETGAEYDLTWSFGTVDSYEDNDTTANATDLTSDEGKLLSESMGYATQGDSDFYRVTLPANSLVLNVDVFFSHNLGNIDVNIHDSIPSVIASADSITDNETLSAPVDPAGGDYFIEVTGANTGNHYDLIWSVDVDDPYEENDSETETHDLAGAENVRLSDDLGLGKQFDEDWYSLTTPAGKISLNVLVDGFSAINGNIDLELYDAADVLVASSADGISSEEIQIAVDPAGETFKVKVFGDNEGNSYDLVWSTSTTDQYEENDFVEDFYDLSDQEGVWLSSVNGLATQADDDWYQIVVSPGATKLTVECTFIHADGDIDLELYRLDPTAEAEKTDPDLDQRKPTLVERKISETDNEEITDFDVTDRPGIYFIRVYFGNAGNAYNLRWFDEDDGDIPVIDIDGDSLFLDEDWFFGESSNSLLDARLLTPLANEDGDDFQNWAEYAFDLDTSIADTVVVDNSRQEIDGKIYFTISFIRKAEADVAGYRFFVEESHDLNFDGSHLAVEDAVVPLDNGLERVTFRSSREISEIPNCFFRIRVEPPAKSY